MRQLNDRAGNHGAGARQQADKTAIDFQVVNWKILQIGQRRVPGSEIVDRQAHAQQAYFVHELHRGVEVIHQHALGQLELEAIGAHACICQRLPDDVDEVFFA